MVHGSPSPSSSNAVLLSLPLKKTPSSCNSSLSSLSSFSLRKRRSERLCTQGILPLEIDIEALTYYPPVLMLAPHKPRAVDTKQTKKRKPNIWRPPPRTDAHLGHAKTGARESTYCSTVAVEHSHEGREERQRSQPNVVSTKKEEKPSGKRKMSFQRVPFDADEHVITRYIESSDERVQENGCEIGRTQQQPNVEFELFNEPILSKRGRSFNCENRPIVSQRPQLV